MNNNLVNLDIIIIIDDIDNLNEYDKLVVNYMIITTLMSKINLLLTS